MIKAAFFDVDGTLVEYKKRIIADSTLKTLKKLRDKGIKLYVATGRTPMSAYFIEDSFRFDGFITLNGQFCFDRSGVIRNCKIDKSDLAAAADYIALNNIYCDFFEISDSYIDMINSGALNSHKDILGGKEAVPPINEPEAAKEALIYQFSPHIDEDCEKDILKILPHCRSVRWTPVFTDIIPAEGGKGVGIEAVCRHLNIGIDETIAFGDGGNDIEMLKAAGTGVAMGNSKETVKAAADYVTDSVENDGITKAFEHFGII